MEHTECLDRLEHAEREMNRLSGMLEDYRIARDEAVAELAELQEENRDLRQGILSRRRTARNRAIRQPGPSRLDPEIVGKAY